MSANNSGDAHVPEPARPVRPSWEVAAESAPQNSPPSPAPRPAALPNFTPPPASAPPPSFTPPPAPTSYALPVESAAQYDLAGNIIPQTAAPSPYAPSTMPGAWPPAPQGRPIGGGGATAYYAASNRTSPDKLVMGIALGLAIGIVAAIIIEKILFYAGFGLSLLYVGMGYGIGWGIHRVVGRGGPGLAMLAVGLMAVSLGVSHLVWAQDVLNAVRERGNASPGATLFDALPLAMSHLGIMHWVCITFGLLACYRGVEQQQSS